MKYIKYILILIVLAGIFGLVTKTNAGSGENCVGNHDLTTKEQCESAGNTWTSDIGYQLLAPLPCTTPGSNGCDMNGKLTAFNPAQPDNLGKYLNLMIKIFIGLCAVLSVVMVVIGGMEYMTSELISSKEAGKERIQHALLGLLIALGAYALLFTINPDLLNINL